MIRRQKYFLYESCWTCRNSCYDMADNKGKCRKHKQDIGCYADMFRMVCDEWES